MARQPTRNVSQNSQNFGSDLHLQPFTESEALLPDEIEADLPEKHWEEQPVFIARMPNLEEPRSLRTAISSQSIWNRLIEMKNRITDRQQIFTLRCVIVFLGCMLFWSMVSKPSPNLPGTTQTETALLEVEPDYLPYRSEKSASPRSEAAYERLSFSDSARSVRESDLDNEEILPVLSTTSIDLSQATELLEEPPPAFDSNQRYTSPSYSASSQTHSAWDREVHSHSSAVPVNAWNSGSAPPNDWTADYSAFAAPNYETPQPPVNEPVFNRYNESQVRQVHYHQNPGTGVYPASPMQAPQSPVHYGQQHPSNQQQNQNWNNQQPSPNSGYNAPNYGEEIPATLTNNTYRNPGTTPQNGYYTQGTGMNPSPVQPQGFHGQNHPQYHPQQSPANAPQYNHPNYGTAVLPVNSLNR